MKGTIYLKEGNGTKNKYFTKGETVHTATFLHCWLSNYKKLKRKCEINQNVR